MVLKLVHENATTKLVGTRPNIPGSYAEIQTRRWTVRVLFLDRALSKQGYFIPAMETLPTFLRNDIHTLQQKRMRSKIGGHQANLKRYLTHEELAEIKRCVYAPIRCGVITVGRPLVLRMPPEGFGPKRFDLGTILDIKVHNVTPRPR